MPKSGWFTQQCKCGGNDHVKVSVTFTGSTLGVTPRRKSRAITIYVCPGCVKEPTRKTRAHIIRSVLRAVTEGLK